LHFFVINHNNQTYIRQRSNERIWHNLFEPPNIETEALFEENSLLTHPDCLAFFQAGKGATLKLWFQTRHQLTHQNIHAYFWMVQPGLKFKVHDKQLRKVTFEELPKYAVHRLFDKFLNFHTLHP
jgi:A/G-specific adenine glycosylase